MTKNAIRGYAVALSLLGFSGVYATTASNPYPSATESATGPAAAATPAQVAALHSRAARLRKRAAAVRRTVAQRTAMAARPAPVRIITLPPATSTRTS